MAGMKVPKNVEMRGDEKQVYTILNVMERDMEWGYELKQKDVLNRRSLRSESYRSLRPLFHLLWLHRSQLFILLPVHPLFIFDLQYGLFKSKWKWVHVNNGDIELTCEPVFVVDQRKEEEGGWRVKVIGERGQRVDVKRSKACLVITLTVKENKERDALKLSDRFQQLQTFRILETSLQLDLHFHSLSFPC